MSKLTMTQKVYSYCVENATRPELDHKKQTPIEFVQLVQAELVNRYRAPIKLNSVERRIRDWKKNLRKFEGITETVKV